MNGHRIVALINEAYENEPNDRHPWPITPSQFGHCQRELALKLAGRESTPIRAESLRVFELGHQRGARLHEVLDGALGTEWSVLTEKRVLVPLPITGEEATDIKVMADGLFGAKGSPVHVDRDTLCLSGSLDTLIWREDRTRAIIVDWKTTSSFGFGKLDKDGPDDGYCVQIHAYRKALLWENFIGTAPDCYLIFEAKDGDARKGHVGGQLKAVEVPNDERTELLYRQAIDGIVEVLRSWMRGEAELVKEPFTIGGVSGKAKALPWQCNYCPIGPVSGGCFGAVEDRGTPKRARYYVADQA